jgi:hypothetical protein
MMMLELELRTNPANRYKIIGDDEGLHRLECVWFCEYT